MKNVSFSPRLLEQAKEALTSEGFTVRTAPLELMLRGCVLTAWHEIKQEGYLIEPQELGMVSRLGLDYLDPNRAGNALPRWQREAAPDALRLRRYAEAVLARACAEVASAPEGVRNQTLNRAAFVLGRYLGWGIDEEAILHDLEQAGLEAGLPYREVTSTLKSALRKGGENPRDPLELAIDEQECSAKTSPWASPKRELTNAWNAPTPWAGSSPWES